MEGHVALLLQTPESHASRLLRALAVLPAVPTQPPPAVHHLPPADDALVACRFASPAHRTEFLGQLTASFLLRHLSRIFQVDRQSDSVAGAVAALAAESSKERVYRLMAFPRADEEALGAQVPLEVALAMSGHTHVFHVARLAPGVVLYGSVPAARHVLCTQPTFAPVSRAYWKLDEAAARFRLPCAGARALDIGAAPGGWTQFLVRAGALRVVAIDPAPLSLPPSEAVVHVALRLQEALGDARVRGGAPYDLLVADMNIHPTEAARLVLLAAPLLRPGAHVCLTCKLVQGFSAAADRDRQVSGAAAVLGAAFDGVEELWLLANGNERTLIARRKAEGSAA